MNDVRVKLELKNGFRTQIKAGAHTLVADEPVKAGGTDEGMSPYELLLSALWRSPEKWSLAPERV